MLFRSAAISRPRHRRDVRVHLSFPAPMSRWETPAGTRACRPLLQIRNPAVTAFQRQCPHGGHGAKRCSCVCVYRWGGAHFPATKPNNGMNCIGKTRSDWLKPTWESAPQARSHPSSQGIPEKCLESQQSLLSWACMKDDMMRKPSCQIRCD